MKRTFLGIIAGITITAAAQIAWAGRDSSGNYTLPTGNPVDGGTVINSAWANTTMADVAAALTDSLSRSGKGGMTAPLKLVNGTASNPSLTWTSSPTTGLYRPSADDVCMSIANNSASECWSSSAQTITNNVGITGNLSASGNGAISGSLAVTGALNVTGNTKLELLGVGGATPGGANGYQIVSADPASSTFDAVAQIGITDPLMLLTGSFGHSSGLGFNVATVSGTSTYVTHNFGGTFTQENGTGDLVFKTAPNNTGAATLTERLRIANAGGISTNGGSINTGGGDVNAHNGKLWGAALNIAPGVTAPTTVGDVGMNAGGNPTIVQSLGGVMPLAACGTSAFTGSVTIPIAVGTGFNGCFASDNDTGAYILSCAYAGSSITVHITGPTVPGSSNDAFRYCVF